MCEIEGFIGFFVIGNYTNIETRFIGCLEKRKRQFIYYVLYCIIVLCIILFSIICIIIWLYGGGIRLSLMSWYCIMGVSIIFIILWVLVWIVYYIVLLIIVCSLLFSKILNWFYWFNWDIMYLVFYYVLILFIVLYIHLNYNRSYDSNCIMFIV